MWPEACDVPADETSRENYEKYGHPDGPQSLNMGVALPEWMFAADSKAAPLLLIGLVSLCILLPLVLMACFLANSNKYMGSGGVMAETMEIFVRWLSATSQPLSCASSAKFHVCEQTQGIHCDQGDPGR